MEQEHPAPRGERGGDEPDGSIGKSRTEEGDQRNARDSEDQRDDAESGQPPAEVHDQPGEAEVKRSAPAFRDDSVQHMAERAATDEERECLVLVRRPGAQEPAEDRGQRRCHRGRSRPEGVHLPDSRTGARERGGLGHELDQGLSLRGVQADNTASVLNLVPTYEYKCPNGHVFEVFKRIANPPPEACPVCGASPVETVLYPVPVHFRGSGFYSTDYGRGGRKRDRVKESSSESGSDPGSGDKTEKKDKPTEKKAAEG